MRGRGFTMVEIAVVFTLLALLVPLVFAFARTFDAGHREALARLEAAQGMRAVSEELRRDLMSLRWQGATTVLAGAAPCERVEYAVDAGGVLSRLGGPGCGGARAVARNVRSLRRLPWGLELVFAHRTGRAQPFETVFTLALASDGASEALEAGR